MIHYTKSTLYASYLESFLELKIAYLGNVFLWNTKSYKRRGEAAVVILLVYSLYRSINIFERKPIICSMEWQFASLNFNLAWP